MQEEFVDILERIVLEYSMEKDLVLTQVNWLIDLIFGIEKKNDEKNSTNIMTDVYDVSLN